MREAVREQRGCAATCLLAAVWRGCLSFACRAGGADQGCRCTRAGGRTRRPARRARRRRPAGPRRIPRPGRPCGEHQRTGACQSGALLTRVDREWGDPDHGDRVAGHAADQLLRCVGPLDRAIVRLTYPTTRWSRTTTKVRAESICWAATAWRPSHRSSGSTPQVKPAMSWSARSRSRRSSGGLNSAVAARPGTARRALARRSRGHRERRRTGRTSRSAT